MIPLLKETMKSSKYHGLGAYNVLAIVQEGFAEELGLVVSKSINISSLVHLWVRPPSALGALRIKLEGRQ
jgi:hypothetical protein